MGRPWLIAGMVLLFVTVAWWRVERFEPAGPPLAVGGPVDASNGWTVIARGGTAEPLPDGVRLTLTGPDCDVDRGCSVMVVRGGPPGPPGLARTTARATWTDVHRGVPRTFGLIGSVRERRSDGGPQAGWPLRDQRRDGHGRRVAVEGVSELGPHGDRWEVWWSLSGVSGTVELTDIRGGPVRTRSFWSLGARGLTLAWGAWVLAGGVGLIRSSVRLAPALLATGVALGIFLGTLSPDVFLDPVRAPLQTSLEGTLEWVSAASESAPPAAAPDPPAAPAPPPADALVRVPVLPRVGWLGWIRSYLSHVDKIAHLLSFTVAGGMGMLALGRREQRMVAVMAFALLAMGTEVLQGFTLDRTARGPDVVLDLLGLTLGLGAGAWVASRADRAGVPGDD